MTTADFSGYDDDALLAALDEARIHKGRLEMEIQHRFEARKTSVIEGGRFTATQRQDVVKYVFSEGQLVGYESELISIGEGYNAGEQVSKLKDAARQISGPRVSLAKKEKTEETPI